MIRQTSIDEFLEMRYSLNIIDVRSEKEFTDGHIPGAINIPILTDEERKIVGTSYKHNGRKPAVYKGLELSGPYLSERLRQGVKLAKDDKVLVHCWRGGMRSEFFAFLLHYYGLEPILLEGGYKSYRTLAHNTFPEKLKIRVLSGKTGTGKTELLRILKEKGEQIIDLEGLAKHRGSAFGALGQTDKPTQEQFENNLFEVLRELNPDKVVWVEDECRTIGDKVIPEGLWTQMRMAPRIAIHKSFEERLEQIIIGYAEFPKEQLIQSMMRIGKRLGPQHVKKAVQDLEEGKTKDAFAIALKYYDKAYEFQMTKFPESSIIELDGQGLTFETITNHLQKTVHGNPEN